MSAANDYWIAPSGNWTHAGNWSTGKLPGTGDTACIESLTSEIVTLDSNQAIYALSVSSNASAGQTSTTALNVLNQTTGNLSSEDESVGGDLYGNGYTTNQAALTSSTAISSRDNSLAHTVNMTSAIAEFQHQPASGFAQHQRWRCIVE